MSNCQNVHKEAPASCLVTDSPEAWEELALPAHRESATRNNHPHHGTLLGTRFFQALVLANADASTGPETNAFLQNIMIRILPAAFVGFLFCSGVGFLCNFWYFLGVL